MAKAMKRPRLERVKALPGFKFDLTFINGEKFVVDMADIVKSNGGLAPLRSGNAWMGVEMTEHGWSIEWPKFDIQIGADTLWMDAQSQHAKTPEMGAFIVWRIRNGLSLASAAKALGITPRTVSAFGTGARPIPLYIYLACKGYDAEQAEERQKKASALRNRTNPDNHRKAA